MTTGELKKWQKPKLVHFKCAMRDELNGKHHLFKECGMINLNTSKEPGSHWACWYKNETKILF